MKTKSVLVDPKRVKAGPEDGLKEGEFIVYPSTFTREPDSYGDVVAKGAFLEDIEAWKSSGNVLPGLYGHRMDDPDYFVAGTIDEGEDDHGWWVHGEFDLEHPKAVQVYKLVKGRRLTQLSFAYDTLEEGKVDLGEGKTANELRKLKRYEFSFVPVGANQDTSVVAVKSATDALVSATNAGDMPAEKHHIDSLRAAQEAIASVIKAAEGDDQEKASGDAEVKSGANDEEPAGAKSSASDEEPKSSPSVNTWATALSLLALDNE